MKKILSFSRKVRGFTMIELLIVISILGILAVAVLSAINPVEQINRGRDTSSRSDAEQLISAVDRFNANKGYFPWQSSENDTNLGVGASGGAPAEIDDTGPLDHSLANASHILNHLSSGDALGAGATTEGTNELKVSYVSRITTTGYRTLYIYNRGENGDSTYVCFAPRSAAFLADASKRCVDTTGTGLPTDIDTTARNFICDGSVNLTQGALTCLP